MDIEQHRGHLAVGETAPGPAPAAGETASPVTVFETAEVSAPAPGPAPAAPPQPGAMAEVKPLDRPAGPGRRPQRLHALDLLRFSAAMFVVAYHYVFAESKTTWAADTAHLFGAPLRHAASYGWLGVELFFMISGFVICMSSWGRSLGDFFTSRVTRLVPAYVFAVALTATVLTLWPAPGKKPPTLPQIAGNFTMMQSLLKLDNLDDPYWTLIIELKFYVLFALVVYFGVTYRRVLLFCLAWSALAVFTYDAQFKPLSMAIEPRYANYFVAGIAFYLIHRFGQSLLLWSVVAFTYLVNAVMLEVRIAPNLKSGLPMSWKTALLIVTCFYILMAGVALGWFKKLSWRGLTTVGALTYPLYLIHMTNGRAVIRHLRDTIPPWPLLLGVVAAALVVAYAIHRLVERPLSGLLRRGLKDSFEKLR